MTNRLWFLSTGAALSAGVTLATVLASCADAAPTASTFATENDVAMKRMMTDMHVPSTGVVDRDFLVMMIPHHQGAIDMCRSLLRHGQSNDLKTLCRDIIDKQGEEIALMRRLMAAMPAGTAPSPSPSPAPAPTPQDDHAHHGH